MPGFAPAGSSPLGTLPSAFSLATPDPIAALLANPYARRTYLVEALPLDSTGTVVPVQLSDDGYRTKWDDSTLPDTPFKGRLLAAHNMTARVMEGGKLLGRSIPAYGDIDVINNDAALDAYADLVWAGRPITTKVGSPAFRYAEFGIIRSGVCEDPVLDTDRISIPARDLQQRLAKPIQTRLYRGTNNCLRFSGATDNATLGTYTATVATTFECWFRCTGTTGASQLFAMHGTLGAWSGMDWILEVQASGGVAAELGRGSSQAILATSSGNYLDSLWHHVALVLQAGAGATKLYVDGALVASATITISATINDALRIGSFAGPTYKFLGEVDEVRLWKVARTQAEIQGAMIGELPSPSGTTLTAYHHLNDASGATATATIGSNGTVTGATWIPSLEGGAELAGKPKPLGFGQLRNVEPILVDAAQLIYQVHDGAYQALDSALDMGAALTGAGDVGDLRGVSVTAGQYKTDLAHGYIKLGTKPIGKLTSDFRGDSTGGYVSTSAAIWRRIVQRYGGLADADLDLGSFAAADVASPAVHGFSTRLEPVNIDESGDKLTGSIGSWWTYTRAGLLQLRQLTDPAAGTPVGTITAAQIRDKGLRRLASVAPSKGQRLGYRRNATTLQPNEVATSVSADIRAQLGEEYRYAVADDTSVLTLYRDAVTWTAETLMDDPTAAQPEAVRRQALFGVRRNVYQVDLRDGLHVYWLGDIVELRVDRWGLGAGKQLVVVGITEDSAQRTTTLELWG